MLYAASIALPAMLQALFGYDAFHAGLVLSPGGISSITMLVIVERSAGPRGSTPAGLIAAGLVVLAASNYLDGESESGRRPVAGRLARGWCSPPASA